MKGKKSIIFIIAIAMIFISGLRQLSRAEFGGSASISLSEDQEKKHKQNNILQKEMKALGKELEVKSGAYEMGLSVPEYEKLLINGGEEKLSKVKEVAKASRYQVIYQSRVEAGNSDLNLYIDDYTNENLPRLASVCFAPIDYHNESRERAIKIVRNGYCKKINELNKKLKINEEYSMLDIPEKTEVSFEYEYEINEEERNLNIEDVQINEENFIDPVFRDYIKEAFDRDKNSILDKEELLNIRKLDISSDASSAKTLNGIEKLPFLEVLNCSYSDLSDIDISNNKNILEVDISGTEIKSIDTLKNDKLAKINISNSKVDKIDLSNNKELWFLDISGTEIKSIDVTKNSKLEHLYIFSTKISDIDVSKNPRLLRLSMSRTAISQVDTSNNPRLFAFDIEETNVKEVDVSNNKDLYEIYMTGAPIQEVDVSNNSRLGHIRLESTKVKEVDLSNNPNIVCVTIGNTDIKNLDLSNNNDIIELLAAKSTVEKIKLPYETGIKVLECNDSNISELNLGQNPYLVGLDISNSKISKLDVSNAKGLSRIEAANTDIKSLDLSNNINLRKINLSNTNIKEMKNLDLNSFSGNKLSELKCNNAGIKSLILSDNMEELSGIDIANNSIPKLNLEKLPDLWYGKEISPQEVSVKGINSNGKISVDMKSLVDDISKVEIKNIDKYNYNDGILTFKDNQGAKKFSYIYNTDSSYKDLDKMLVNVSVESEKVENPSKSGSSKNKNSNDINANLIKIEDNIPDINNERIIKSIINKSNSRISGKNRFSTAVEMSKLVYKQSDTAIIVNSDKISDVLTASPLSEIIKSPILYVGENNIAQETMSEIKRLKVKKIIIIGGEKSVSSQVENKFSSKYKIQRIAGKNRFETSNLIANIVMDKNQLSKKAILVSANAYSDALAISPLASKEKLAILITDADILSNETEDFIKSKKIESIIYAGGNKSISNNVQKQVEKLGANTLVRYAGEDRYETASQIAAREWGASKYAVCVSGENLSDAIIANSLAANLKSPILLITNKKIPNSVKDIVNKIQAENRLIVGGENTISRSVMNELKK